MTNRVVRFYPYLLTLEESLVATSLEGDANAPSSYPFIPGSLIRGAVARALQAEAGDRFRELLEVLVLSGDVCYLNAYPAAGDRRSLPTPLSLRRDKYGERRERNGEKVYDLASGHWAEGQLTRVGTAFVAGTPPVWESVPVRLSERLHHRRDPATGRPGRGEGSLFVLTALTAGQRFAGVVAVAGRDVEEVEERFRQVQAYLRSPLLLGRSRRAGYGGMAHLRWLDDQPLLREVPYLPPPVPSGGLPPGQRVAALLTADYVGRDPETGQPDPRAIEKELRSRLPVRVVHWFADYRPVGGYNRKWGLPLPQVPALRAGTVLVLEAEAPLEAAALEAVEQEGLGERRAEGFGRLVFLPVPSSSAEIRPPREGSVPRPAGSPPALVLEMEERLVRAALAEHVDALAVEWAQGVQDGTPIPSPSLLSRLRVPLRAGPEGLGTLGSWLDPGSPHALRKPARRQLEACRLRIRGREVQLDEHLQAILTAEPEVLGRMLRVNEVLEKCYLVSLDSARDIFTRCLAEWARHRLVDAFLAALARVRKGGQSDAS